MSSRSLLRLTAAVAVTALALTGCATSSESPEEPPTSESSLNALLPDHIREAGVISIATDPTYPPVVYLDADGSTVTGFVPEVLAAMGNHLDVEIEYTTTKFAGIIAGVQASRYDAGIIFVNSEERREVVTMVDLFKTGHQFMVAADYNGPSDAPACGSTIAAAAGTFEVEVATEFSDEKCVANGLEPYDVQEFPSNDTAAVALLSDRADAFITTAENASYRVKQDSDKVATLGPIFEPHFDAIALPKQDEQFMMAIAGALRAIIDSGEYAEILESWEAGALAVEEVQVNGQPFSG